MPVNYWLGFGVSEVFKISYHVLKNLIVLLCYFSFPSHYGDGSHNGSFCCRSAFVVFWYFNDSSKKLSGNMDLDGANCWVKLDVSTYTRVVYWRRLALCLVAAILQLWQCGSAFTSMCQIWQRDHIFQFYFCFLQSHNHIKNFKWLRAEFSILGFIGRKLFYGKTHSNANLVL